VVWLPPCRLLVIVAVWVIWVIVVATLAEVDIRLLRDHDSVKVIRTCAMDMRDMTAVREWLTYLFLPFSDSGVQRCLIAFLVMSTWELPCPLSWICVILH
jgi:hypothetical protein